MARSHQIIIDGQSLLAPSGWTLLDAALQRGIDLSYDCRSGHCGTCCVRVVSGSVRGGEGVEPGIVHACQCRIVGDVVVERHRTSEVVTVDGTVSSIRSLSSDVLEVGIKTSEALPYHAGQYAQIAFNGYPSRPFSLTHPLPGGPTGRSVFFHVRRMPGGRVTSALGKSIRKGHRAKLTGPFGSAHFRPGQVGRIILVATSTGFAPIWSIAVAALREDPDRAMMIIAGGRSLESLYMAPALVQLASFRNVRVVPVCSTQGLNDVVKFGRPPDYLPMLFPTDTVYACGAPGMVEAVKAIAARAAVTCYADPFVPNAPDPIEERVLNRARGWLSGLAKRRDAKLATGRPSGKQRAVRSPRAAGAGMKSQSRSQSV